MKKEQNTSYESAMKVAKRITLTIICCVPFMIAFGYLTRNVITNSAIQIICFMLIMAVAVAVVEIVARRRESRRQAKRLLDDKKDVFK